MQTLATPALVSFLMALSVAVPRNASAHSVPTAEQARAIWSHHIGSWEERSLERIVQDYGDDSVLILNNRLFVGRNAIGTAFECLFEIFDRGTNRIDAPVFLASGVVYIAWRFTPDGDREHFGTDTFVIDGGDDRKPARIVLQTIGSSLYDTRGCR